VFRRGDIVWMVFDTEAGIVPPESNDALNSIASGFSVIPSGDTQVVRIDLSKDRLATLGSEGMAWVLSLGDIMLTPTEPVALTRRRDLEGLFEMTANLERPARVHEFRDPSVGDVLEVVTAYPPARGLTRTLDYVDFSALRSVHGLVVKPANLDVKVAIDNDLAVISTDGGLTVSALDHPRENGSSGDESTRSSFLDLARLEEKDPAAFVTTREQLSDTAANADGRERDVARLNLADYYLANQFAHEAIGVLHVLENELKDKNLTRKVRMSLAIADTMAVRPKDALDILNAPSLADAVDALLWRTIARVDANDFKGARNDALGAQSVVNSYPLWVRNKFYFAAVRAAVESDDVPMAERMLNEIDFGSLDKEEVSLYHLLSGRIDEAAGRTDEAIDTYGQVIAADVRPTRAEAIYRTLGLLDSKGNLDLKKATDTLAAEALLWRGNPLESDMQRMLAKLYFREGAYREGFETVKQAVANYPESPPINELRDDAQKVFSDLYLDGLADSLGPVDALSLYYDFRQLTPAGAKGDEMIRNLARRLVRVDLLAQAAQLLDYQLENRLHGVARTQIAADLAVIYLADRKPQDALRVLNSSRLPDIPPSLERQRKVLEARALIDGGRDGLALDVLRDMDGQDADVLRVDAHWKAGRYSQASEMIEGMVAARDPAEALSQPTRMNLIKAAVGYVLSGDDFGTARLRSKFADRMATTPEWPMFDYVTGKITTNSLEFKKVASDVSGMDGLNAFLDSYRQTYGGTGALAPPFATTGEPALASAQ
jgi:tetratricopeptide (TPR) repeat protein